MFLRGYTNIIFIIYFCIYNLEMKIGTSKASTAAVKSGIPDHFPQTVFLDRKG